MAVTAASRPGRARGRADLAPALIAAHLRPRFDGAHPLADLA